MNESNEQLKIISYLAQHLSFGPAANLYKNVQIIKSIYSLFMGDHFNTICVSLTSSHFFILIFTYFLSCTEKNQNFRTWIFPCQGAFRNGPSGAGLTICRKLFFFCCLSRTCNHPISLLSSSPAVSLAFGLKVSVICSPSRKFSRPGCCGVTSDLVFFNWSMLLVLISIPEPGVPPTW